MNKKFKNLDLIEFVCWAPGYGPSENKPAEVDASYTVRSDRFEGRNVEGRTYSDQRMLDERNERRCNAEREAERREMIAEGEVGFGMLKLYSAYRNRLKREIDACGSKAVLAEDIRLYCAEHGINFDWVLNQDSKA